MNLVFTLNYLELQVAEKLNSLFQKTKGFSTLIPLSSQQKGYDLALMRRTTSGSSVATFQVKSSRTYAGQSGTSPRSKVRTFKNYMWLNTFAVPEEADFFVLIGFYAASPTNTKKKAGVWQPHMLLFTLPEMKELLGKIRQRKSNTPDKHYGFGFDSPDEAFLTRGHAETEHPDYSVCFRSEST